MLLAALPKLPDYSIVHLWLSFCENGNEIDVKAKNPMLITAEV